MPDLSQFYQLARDAQSKSAEAEAGHQLLSQYGYTAMPAAPAEPATGEVRVKTNAEDLGTPSASAKPRQGERPQPQGAIKIEGELPQPMSVSARGGQPESSPEALAQNAYNAYGSHLDNLLTTLLANTDNPEKYAQDAVELFQKSPRDFETGLQQLLTVVGMSQPAVNSVMALTRNTLKEAGAGETTQTVGELLAGAMVPSKMAVNVAGRAASNRAALRAGLSSNEVGRYLASDLEKGGGFSYSRRFNKAVKPTEGFGVSVAPELERTFTGKASPEDIAKFVEENRRVLTNPRAVTGGWFDEKTGKTHLDVSTVVKDRARAEKLAASTGQRAIYDFKTGESYPVAYGTAGPHPYNAPAEPLKPNDIATAQAYDAAMSNPALKPQWDALAAETDKLYAELSKSGPRMELVPGQPYASAEQMAREVQETGVMKVSSDNMAHPFWTPEQNARFRYVHDMLGHVEAGNDFSLEGEYRAWLSHETKLNDDAAKIALKTEVYGQASSAIANSGKFPEQKAVDLGASGLAPIEERLAAGRHLGLTPEQERAADLMNEHIARVQDLARRPETEGAGPLPGQGSEAERPAAPAGTPAAEVEKAGARFDGVNELLGENWVWFTDPKTGSTLMVKLEDATEENIARHLAESRKAWGISGGSGSPTDEPLPGFVRLYRGEGPRNAPPTWRQDPEMEGLRGRWFTSDKADAMNYQRMAREAGQDGALLQVDVPEEIANAARVQGNPDYEKLTLLPYKERVYVLPPEWTSKAVRIGGAAGAGAAVFGDPETDPYAGTSLGMALGVGTGNLKYLRSPSLAQDLLKLRKGGKLFNALVADGAAAMARGGVEAWEKQMAAYGVPAEQMAELLARSKEVAGNGLSRLEKDLRPLEEMFPAWRAAAGRPDWYGSRAVLVKAMGPDADLMSGLLAATSPGRGAKDVNIDAALKVYKVLKTEPKKDWKRIIGDLDLAGEYGTKSTIPNVMRAIEGEPLSGNKVNDFHGALLGDESRFTVDRHMVRLFAPDSMISMSGDLNDAEYALISNRGKEFAQNIGETPRYTQQRLWIGQRLLNELDDAGNLPFFETFAERAKDQGILDLVPKGEGLGEEGRTKIGMAWMLGRTAAGAVAGSYFGDTTEERMRNGLLAAGFAGVTPAVITKISRWATENAPAIRNLVRKPTNVYPPEVQAALEKAFTGYDADLAAFTRGVRPHSMAWAEAEQMIRSGQMSLESVKAFFPGHTMNDSEAMALIKTVADYASDVQAYAKGLQSTVAAGKPLAPDQISGFLSRLYTLREFLPRPRGVVAEAGRTLSAMNEPTKGLNEYLAQWHHIFSDPVSGLSPDKLIQAVSDFKTAEQHLALARLAQQPGWTDYATEGLYGMLLGGPITQIVNAGSNSIALAYAPIERLGAAAMGDVVKWNEPFALLKGYAKSTPLAFANAKRAFLTGERAFGGYSKVQTPTGPISGITSEALERSLIGKIAETAVPLSMAGGLYAAGVDPATALAAGVSMHPRFWPLGPRAMVASDELFKTMLYHGELNALAVRRAAGVEEKFRKQVMLETLRNPNSIVKANAERFANEFTYNAEPGPVMKGLIDGMNSPDLPGPYKVLAKTVLPFTTIPTNILKFTGRRTPMLQQLHAQWWSDLTSPGPRQDTAMGQLAMGAAMLTAIADAAHEGVFVGSGPADPKELELWKSMGNQENSVRFGDKSISINRMDPWGNLATIMADWSAIAAHIPDAENEQIAAALLMVVSKDMMSKSYLENGSAFLEAITNKDPNKAYHWLYQYAGTPVPALVKTMRNQQDPYMREVRDLVDASMNKVPGLSKNLPVRKNIFADPLINHEPIGYGIDYVNPFTVKTVKNDIAAEKVIANHVAPSMPSWSIYGSSAKEWTLDPQRESVGVPLDGKLRDELIDLIGKPLKKEWTEFVQSSAYDSKNEGPDSANALVFRKLHAKFTKAGVAELVDRHPELLRGLEDALYRRGTALQQPLAPRQPAAQPSILDRLQGVR